jgi:Uncharacterized integral membrane protein
MIKSCFEFSYKAASAALFGILLLIAFALTQQWEVRNILAFYRYDYLLFYALIIQVCLLYLKLESWAEAKVIALFHLSGYGDGNISDSSTYCSWQYPQPAVLNC